MNRSHDPRLAAYSFTEPIQGSDPDHVPGIVRPRSGLEQGQALLENILRWEDDGGPVFEVWNPLPRLAETNTPCPVDVVKACFAEGE